MRKMLFPGRGSNRCRENPSRATQPLQGLPLFLWKIFILDAEGESPGKLHTNTICWKGAREVVSASCSAMRSVRLGLALSLPKRLLKRILLQTCGLVNFTKCPTQLRLITRV